MGKLNRLLLPIAVIIHIVICTKGLSQDTLQPMVFYYENGKISGQGYMLHGKPEGYWRSYDEEGNLRSEGNRKNFLLDGRWVFYNPDHSIQQEINYLNDKKQGERKTYTSEGCTIDHFQNDTIVGTSQVLRQDNSLWKTIPYIKGKANGLAKEFDKQGNLITTLEYHNGHIVHRENVNRTNAAGEKTGRWLSFWENENLQTDANYKNNRLHGIVKQYDQQGNLLSVENYINGILQTDAGNTKKLESRIDYHPNGKFKTIASYFKGVPEGVRREYDTAGKVVAAYIFSEGALIAEGILDDQGKRQGEWTEYYTGGEVRAKGNYKNSKPIKKWKYFFENGKVEIMGEYDTKGRKIGEWLRFYENGDTAIVQHFNAGFEDGRYVEYDRNGKCIVSGWYEEGEETGEWTIDIGTCLQTGNYENGLRSGKWTSYYKEEVQTPTDSTLNADEEYVEKRVTKRLLEECNYTNGQPDGKYIACWRSGNKQCEGVYNYGKRHGRWRIFNEDGQPIVIITYKDGVETHYDNIKLDD
ncbi:MAG: hypothetical protein J5605_09960 [Bacteroidales bacterium]|nr:hypothetical protein [Bacteroidales bacterium]